MSKRSRRSKRRARRARFLHRFTRSAPFGCITCSFEALCDDGAFRCAAHGPLSGDQKEAWKRRHPGYVRAQRESEPKHARR